MGKILVVIYLYGVLMTKETERSISNIHKGVGIIFIGIIISNIIGLLTQILFGRLLGPENYGLFNLGLSLITMVGTLIPLGLSTGLTQYIPHNMAQKKYNNVNEAVNFSLRIPLLIGTLIACIFFIFSDQIAVNIFHNLKFGLVIKIFSIALPFWALHTLSGSLMQSFKKPKFYVCIENILMPVTQLLTFIIIYFVGYALFGAIIGFILSASFASIAYLYIYRTKLRSLFQETTSSDNINKTTIHKDLFSISLPLFLAGFTFLFMQYTDKILLGIYMSVTDVGIYAAALSIASLMLVIYNAFSFNFRPVLAEYFALNDFNSMRQIYKTVTKWIFLITFPLLIYIVFFSKDILVLIYGNSFTSGYLVLAILAIGISLNGLTGLSGETLISMRLSKLNLFSEIVGSSSNVILNLMLIPFLGILGAALGTSLSLLFRNGASLFFVYKKLNVNIYSRVYIKIGLVSILSFITIFSIIRVLNLSYGFIIALPSFLIIYLILSIFTGCLDNQDKNLLKKIIITLFKYIKLDIKNFKIENKEK